MQASLPKRERRAVVRAHLCGSEAPLLPQRDLTGAVLADRMLGLARDPVRRAAAAAAARRLARPDAARVIVDRALALVRR